MGAQQDFKIWTDHQNLAFFFKAQKLNHQQAHWFMEPAEYHFMLLHKPGHTMIKADMLTWKDSYNKEQHNKSQIQEYATDQDNVVKKALLASELLWSGMPME